MTTGIFSSPVLENSWQKTARFTQKQAGINIFNKFTFMRQRLLLKATSILSSIN